MIALCSAIALALMVQPAMATVTLYTNKADFDRATIGITTLNFNGIAAPGKYVLLGRTAPLGNVLFNSYFALYAVDPANYPVYFDYGTGGVLTAAQDIWANLPSDITAVGMLINTRIYKQDRLFVNLSTGDSYVFPTNGGAQNGFKFIGFVSDASPISAIYCSTSFRNALVIDNFAYGKARAAIARGGQ